MEIREATEDDVDAIRSIASESLNSTYTDFLGEETVESAVGQWYDDDSLRETFADENALVLVVERDGEVVAFSQSDLVGQQHGTGRLLWLHVHPDHRGGGTGVRLLVRTRERLIDEGADQVQAFVLEGNEGGNEFYRAHGFERAGQREVEIGGETFTENVYVERATGRSEAEDTEDVTSDDEAWDDVDKLDLEEETIYVSYGEPARGSKSLFYTAYETEDKSERYGYLCGNCDTVDNTMDTMGRIECNVCGNRRKGTRWDASYL